MVPNGHLQFPSQHTIPMPARAASKTHRNAPEVIALENKNWLIQYHYNRREFGICNILIKEELKKSNGMNEFANYIQGIILRNEGKIQESLEYFQRCHLLNPKGVDNIKQIARSLFLLGRQKSSLEAFDQAKNAAQAPEWDVYHNLGVCCIAVGDINKAKEYLRQAVQLNRQDKSFEALANIHLAQNDVKGAIDIYNAALEIAPENSELTTSLGLLYMKIGEDQKAFEKFGSALAHDPKHPKALVAVGAMMQTHKEYDVALSKYKVAMLYSTESASLWNNIGMCFFGKRKFIAAISCLKKANYTAPFDWKILYNLGLVHLISHQYASAFHYLSSAISLSGNTSTTYLALAVALIHLKDFKNARYAFEQASNASSKDPVVFLNYSVFLYKQGELKRAEEQFKHFQELCQKVSDIDYDVLEAASHLRKCLKNSGVSEGKITRATAKQIPGSKADSNEAESNHAEKIMSGGTQIRSIGEMSNSKSQECVSPNRRNNEPVAFGDEFDNQRLSPEGSESGDKRQI